MQEASACDISGAGSGCLRATLTRAYGRQLWVVDMLLTVAVADEGSHVA